MKDDIAVKCQEGGKSEGQLGQRRQVPHVRLTEMTLEAWESVKLDELSKNNERESFIYRLM